MSVFNESYEIYYPFHLFLNVYYIQEKHEVPFDVGLRMIEWMNEWMIDWKRSLAEIKT